MPRRAYMKRWPVAEELVEDLRFRFLSDITATPSEVDEYHPSDLERVKEDNWFITRYLLHNNENVDDALKMLKESLKFRKELEINTITRADLPAEYFNLRAVITYNKDKKDHPLVVVRTKTHTRNEETRRQQQQYFLYWLERAVKGSDWGIVSVLFDCTDATIGNMDMDMIRFIMNVFKKYYPWGLSSFFVCNMPWILSAFWKVIKGFIPEQYVGKITFVDSNSIKAYIDADQLPICLGGTCTKMYEPKEGIQDDTENYENESLSPQTVRC